MKTVVLRAAGLPFCLPGQFRPDPTQGRSSMTPLASRRYAGSTARPSPAPGAAEGDDSALAHQADLRAQKGQSSQDEDPPLEDGKQAGDETHKEQQAAEPMRRARSSGWRLLRRLGPFFGPGGGVAAGGVGTDGDGEGAPGAVEPIELIQGTRVPLRPSQRPYRWSSRPPPARSLRETHRAACGWSG